MYFWILNELKNFMKKTIEQAYGVCKRRRKDHHHSHNDGSQYDKMIKTHPEGHFTKHHTSMRVHGYMELSKDLKTGGGGKGKSPNFYFLYFFFVFFFVFFGKHIYTHCNIQCISITQAYSQGICIHSCTHTHIKIYKTAR